MSPDSACQCCLNFDQAYCKEFLYNQPQQTSGPFHCYIWVFMMWMVCSNHLIALMHIWRKVERNDMEASKAKRKMNYCFSSNLQPPYFLQACFLSILRDSQWHHHTWSISPWMYDWWNLWDNWRVFGIIPFQVGGKSFDKMFFVIDIYPAYSWFVKAVQDSLDCDEKIFTKLLEPARKVVERAFGLWFVVIYQQCHMAALIWQYLNMGQFMSPFTYYFCIWPHYGSFNTKIKPIYNLSAKEELIMPDSMELTMDQYSCKISVWNIDDEGLGPTAGSNSIMEKRIWNW